MDKRWRDYPDVDGATVAFAGSDASPAAIVADAVEQLALATGGVAAGDAFGSNARKDSRAARAGGAAESAPPAPVRRAERSLGVGAPAAQHRGARRRLEAPRRCGPSVRQPRRRARARIAGDERAACLSGRGMVAEAAADVNVDALGFGGSLSSVAVTCPLLQFGAVRGVGDALTASSLRLPPPPSVASGAGTATRRGDVRGAAAGALARRRRGAVRGRRADANGGRRRGARDYAFGSTDTGFLSRSYRPVAASALALRCRPRRRRGAHAGHAWRVFRDVSDIR